jgi:peroxiredoxin 2/4
MKHLALFLMAVIFISANVNAQEQIPLIGSKAPSFTAESTQGKITFPDDYGKNWKILFSHPQDFTPVCSSELLELAYMQSDFEKLGVKMAVISTDNLDQHSSWVKYLEEVDYKGRGTQQIKFPLFEDQKAKISKKYGMLHKPVSTSQFVRGVFIIDENNIVRSVNFYPMEVGRNIDEIQRVVVALQTTDKADVLTPANWNKGDDLIVPYFPYTNEELVQNPELEKKYYNVGNRIWFKKAE